MISYPPPQLDRQKAEILQRYAILCRDDARSTTPLAHAIAIGLQVPYVMAAVNERYQSWYRCEFGLTNFRAKDTYEYFAHMNLAQSTFEASNIINEDFFTSHSAKLDLPDFRSIAGTPLKDPNGKRLGTLCVADHNARAFGSESLKLLESFAAVVSNDICVRSASRYAVSDLVNLEKEKCELYELATVDPLTGALNRRAFNKFGDREVSRLSRKRTSITALMLDVDHFKRVNDDYGHNTGDQVLSKLVTVTTTFLREEDLIGRLGGEEFAVILIDASADQSAIVAERIRTAIKDVVFSCEQGDFSVTVSIGVSEANAHEKSISHALARADEALYKAKRNGRNRVELERTTVAPPKLTN